MSALRRRLEAVVAGDRADSRAARRGAIIYRHIYHRLWTLFPGETAQWNRRSSNLIEVTVYGERFGRYEDLAPWDDHRDLFKQHGRLTA